MRTFRPHDILTRIKVATPNSPIAVFKHIKGLDCYIMGTVVTLERVHCQDFVGEFHNEMDLFGVEKYLYKAEKDILNAML